MKVLCSQAVASSYRCGVVPCQITAKVSAPQTPWRVPWFVAPQGISGGDSRFKAVDFYALSWGVPRKPA